MAPYLTSTIGPGQVIEDKGMWVHVSETLGDISAHARASASSYAHHGQYACQPVTALHLSPDQIDHSLLMLGPMNTEPVRNSANAQYKNTMPMLTALLLWECIHLIVLKTGYRRKYLTGQQ